MDEARLCDTCDECLAGECVCDQHDDPGAYDDYLYDTQRDMNLD